MNGPLGLEHGFTVAAPPDDEADSIVLELAVGRGWRARAAGDDAIALEEIGGPGRLRYAHLAAVDAAGTVLPASMPDSTRIPAPAGRTSRPMVPGEGRKPLAGSSA